MLYLFARVTSPTRPRSSYYLLMLKLSLILIALQTYNLLTVSYSMLWLLVFVIFLSSVYRWRIQIRKVSRRRELEEDATSLAASSPKVRPLTDEKNAGFVLVDSSAAQIFLKRRR